MKQTKKPQEKTPMEKHPNYLKYLDEIAKLTPEEKQEMDEFYDKYMMRDEEDNEK